MKPGSWSGKKSASFSCFFLEWSSSATSGFTLWSLFWVKSKVFSSAGKSLRPGTRSLRTQITPMTTAIHNLRRSVPLPICGYMLSGTFQGEKCRFLCLFRFNNFRNISSGVTASLRPRMPIPALCTPGRIQAPATGWNSSLPEPPGPGGKTSYPRRPRASA